MPAGTNCKIRVWRLNYLDDEVGGAYPSGTVLHENLDARIEEELTETSFIQQGLQTQKTFSGLIWGHALQIREQDEIEVISPPNHQYYGKYFRVEDSRYDSRHPAIKQGYLLVRLTRSQISHGESYQ